MDCIVIAIGGNALLNPSGKQYISKENRNIDKVASSIARICKTSRVIITHGNGSQIGDELMRNEHAKKFIPKHPLYILNAETQAQIGSILETSLRNKGIKQDISVILSHVLVEKNDKAFKTPTKQIGPFYTKEELGKELKLDRFDYKKIGNKYRMVVASPKPKEILEIYSIKEAGKRGIVIACGGGGIPTIKENGQYKNVNAVIDKDLTSQLLANSVKADKLVILTNADYVYSDYKNKKGKIKKISAKILKRNLDKFEDGTMKPKIEACVNFIENGGKSAYIGNIHQLEKILTEASGTKIM